jgi:hypothetical protein
VAGLNDALEKANAIDGAIGVAFVDFQSGTCLGARGGEHLDMELAGAGTTEVVRSQLAVMEQVGVDETIEDILVTLDNQHHLLHFLHEDGGVYAYLILDKDRASLGLARSQLRSIGGAIAGASLRDT